MEHSGAAGAIIAKLGGTRAAARLLGLAPSTIQSWKESGVIPARRQRLVLDRARAHGVPLDLSELVAQAPHVSQAEPDNLAAA